MGGIISVPRVIIQYAALPFKVEDGKLFILMVTSKETKRWILPKGRPEKRRKAYEVAAQEAFEEGGVAGYISTKTIGGFPAVKRAKTGTERATWVRVYLMRVDRELPEWPEMHERQRQWVAADQASKIAVDQGLQMFLDQFVALWPNPAAIDIGLS